MGWEAAVVVGCSFALDPVSGVSDPVSGVAAFLASLLGAFFLVMVSWCEAVRRKAALMAAGAWHGAMWPFCDARHGDWLGQARTDECRADVVPLGLLLLPRCITAPLIGPTIVGANGG
ncbi:hypothetical protein PLESTM_002006800 [Pleodorina starrii]|nr:hypothetical protein PLESTM_002006800 [Pleodorina starrii]